MKIILVVGARPNFVKISPLIKAIKKHNNTSHQSINYVLVHTGQHYDPFMSDTFFQSLEIPQPHFNLGIGSGTHAEQVGHTMIAFEKILKSEKPDWVVVVGDVNATLACSVTAKKEQVKVCHIEAGLRSGDIKMPEEINRLVTDRLSDLLLTPDQISTNNLQREGTDPSRIKMVGNIMIDSLNHALETARTLDLNEIIKRNSTITLDSHFEPENYALITLHRPSNVDLQKDLTKIVTFLSKNAAKEIPLVWPVHPRTLKNLTKFELLEKLKMNPNIFLLKPLSYFDMLKLNSTAKVVITDSGGLQEECTVLGTPCLTMRFNTERPITLQERGGTSTLVGTDLDKLEIAFKKALRQKRSPHIPELWDGQTADRCLQSLIETHSQK
ncbi:non-hydrolyzing UDP-N-acetylglucosamine 2-epimerase [Reichenbachiella sp.]|uniref:non-hydrolyzing UDP-N-acetylglucosamine 2-epimerase n=1 Tax=Reichenbachiella sp. TaxID=2184521 RepID=UPI003B5A2DC5